MECFIHYKGKFNSEQQAHSGITVWHFSQRHTANWWPEHK